MKAERSFAVLCLMLAVLFSTVLHAQDKKGGNPYACVEPNAESLCNAANTCGGNGGACSVDVKRDNYGTAVTPNISGAKKNQLFCVKAGTQVNFDTSSKNTGYVLDFGPKSPFDREDSIIGGTKKPDSATAKNPGCYRFSAGACVSGAIYGMCKSQMAEMVVTK